MSLSACTLGDELNTEEWDLVLFFRKLENRPELKKLLMDEAEKFAELAETKEQGMGIMLLEDMIARGEVGQAETTTDLKGLRQILERARKPKRKK